MANGVCKVILVGNVGQDPEIRYLQSGGSVANLSVATSESWKDKNTGEKKTETEWHRVCVFGNLADIVSQYVKKGSKVYLEGKLKTRKWQDQAGQDRYTTEIVVDGFSGVMQMLDSKGDGGQGGAPSQAPAPPQKDYVAEYMAMNRDDQVRMWPSYTQDQQQAIMNAAG